MERTSNINPVKVIAVDMCGFCSELYVDRYLNLNLEN